MAYEMTYNNLVSDVIKYSERSDTGFVDQIPMLIGIAEKLIISEVKTLWEINSSTISVSAGTSTLNKPVRWRETVSMKINGQPLLHRSPEYVSQYQVESSQGIPQFYSDVSYSQWSIAPVPNATYSIDVLYYNQVTPLDVSNQTNLITQVAPQAMLYGTLLQAQGYLKNPEKLQLWQGLYDKAMLALKSEDTSRNIDRNTGVLKA